MKVVLLAGGLGTRISEESQYKPKPMIEIGGMPILWHIMKSYSFYGFNDFIICAGYKQHMIKEWFADYFLHTSDVTFDFTKKNEIVIISGIAAVKESLKTFARNVAYRTIRMTGVIIDVNNIPLSLKNSFLFLFINANTVLISVHLQAFFL